MAIWLKRKYNVKIKPFIIKKEYGVNMLNVDRTFKGKYQFEYAGKGIVVYPVTLVNLLGFYGNFEKDSDGDGLADGISATAGTKSLVSGIINDYAQRVTGDGSVNIIGIAFRFNIQNTHIYFARAYSKLSDITNATGHGIYYAGISGQSGDLSWISRNLDPSDTWTIKKALFSGTADGDIYIDVYGFFDIATNSSGVSIDIDGFAIYDLTNMGQLPDPMKQIYGVDNWSDLTDDQLAELLPFVNGVATLGYQIWEEW